MPIPGNTSPESLIRPSSKRHRTVIEGSPKDARSMNRASMAAVGVRWATFSLAPFALPPTGAFPLADGLRYLPWRRYFRRRLGGLPTMPRRVAANKRGARSPRSLFPIRHRAPPERHLARAAPFDQRARSARSTSEVGHAEIHASSRSFAAISDPMIARAFVAYNSWAIL